VLGGTGRLGSTYIHTFMDLGLNVIVLTRLHRKVAKG